MKTLNCPLFVLTLASCLWLSIPVAPAWADRDIVYSARYFYPPHDRRISHYHIYRINPDGTGRIALTHGNRGDYSPVWSPDGKHVMFLRAYTKDNAWIRSLCVVAAEGGKVKTLLEPARREIGEYGWSPDGRWLAYALPGEQPDSGYYSPSSQVVLINVKTGRRRKIPSAAAFVWSANAKRLIAWLRFSEGDLRMRVIEPDSGKTTLLGTRLYDPVWLDNRTWIGIEENAHNPTLKVVGIDGKAKQIIQPRLPAANNADEYQTATLLASILDDPYHVALGFKYGRTAYEWFTIDLHTRIAARLSISDKLTWSPDRKWFCGAPERALAPYGAGREFVAPLYLYNSSGKRLRNLTPGIVYTEGADWRRQPGRQNRPRTMMLSKFAGS
jgi:hypothetical protein